MKKKHYLVLIGLIFIAILLKIRPNNKGPSLPKEDDVRGFSLINILDGRGIERWTISDKDDIEKFLQELDDSKKIRKESISDFPDKNNFILVRFKMSDGGYIRSTIYEEDKKLYFEQAYVGIYELSSKDISSFLESSVKEEDRENISEDLEDILDDDF